jgi:hypothetical protein
MGTPPGRGKSARIELTRTEEWLLNAIRGASKPDGATLTKIIEWGDALNRAIFTPAELRSGFARLLAARVITEKGGRWFINERNRNPNGAGKSSRVPPLSDADVHEAVAAYQQRMTDFRKKRS